MILLLFTSNTIALINISKIHYEIILTFAQTRLKNRVSESSDPDEANDIYDDTNLDFKEYKNADLKRVSINLANQLGASHHGRSFISQVPNLLQVPTGSRYQNNRRRHSWIPGAR